MEQFIHAATVLYRSPDPGQRKEADQWLQSCQLEPEAWAVCSDVLSQQTQICEEAAYLAAHTLRTKVQLDFEQLSSIGPRGVIKSALLQHVSVYREQVRTQIALAIAGCAVQLGAEWGDVVQSLIARFCNDKNNTGVLLEILQYLPEESRNDRILADERKRYEYRDRLRAETTTVLRCLDGILDTNAHRRQIMQCLLAWLRFGSFSADELGDYRLVYLAFDTVCDQDFALADASAEVIVEILQICADELAAFQPLVTKLMPYLQKLQNVFAQQVRNCSQQDPKLVRRLVRIFTETGECLVDLIVDQIDNDQIINDLLNILLLCLTTPPDIAIMSFDFWHKLGVSIQNARKRELFQQIYMDVWRGTIKAAHCPITGDCGRFDEEEWDAFRCSLYQLAQDCLLVLDANEVLDEGLKLLINCSNDALMKECHLFILAATASQAQPPSAIQRTDGAPNGTLAFDVLSALPSLLQSYAQDRRPLMGLKVCERVGIAVVRFVDTMSRFVIEGKQELIENMLAMLSTILLSPPWEVRGTGTGTGKEDGQLLREAARTFLGLCSEGKKELQPMITKLVDFSAQTRARFTTCSSYLQHNSSSSSSSSSSANKGPQILILEGVILVAAYEAPNNNSLFSHVLERLCSPVIADLRQCFTTRSSTCCGDQNTRNNNMHPIILQSALDEMTALLGVIRIRQEKSPKGQCVGTLACDVMGPLIIRLLMMDNEDDGSKRYDQSSNLGSNALIAGKACNVLCSALRAVPEQCTRILEPMAKMLIQGFTRDGHACYINLLEKLGETYGGAGWETYDNKNAAKEERNFVNTRLVGDVFGTILERCLSRIRSHASVAECPDLAEEFFRLSARCLQYYPRLLLFGENSSSTTCNNNKCNDGIIDNNNTTLLPQLLQCALSVLACEQKEAVEATATFLGLLYQITRDVTRQSPLNGSENKFPLSFKRHLTTFSPNLVSLCFQLMQKLAPRYVVDLIPSLLMSVKQAVGHEHFGPWLYAPMANLHPQVASVEEKEEWYRKICYEDRGCSAEEEDEDFAFNQATQVVWDMAYRCEQVALRHSRGALKKG